MFEGQSEKLERAKARFTKREALLRGELQVEGVRRLMGLELKSEYPTLNELPERFFLPTEIIPRVASMTRQQLKKGKEVECFIGFQNGKYWLSKVHVGAKYEVTDQHRDLFPSRRPDYVLAEVHTHAVGDRIGDLVPPQSSDIASLLVYMRGIPGMIISSDAGGWFIVTGKEYFETIAAMGREEQPRVFQEIKSFAQRSWDLFQSSKTTHFASDMESLLAAVLEKYGAVLYSSNPDFLKAPYLGPKPILDPKQKVEMVRVSGETHKKFLAE